MAVRTTKRWPWAASVLAAVGVAVAGAPPGAAQQPVGPPLVAPAPNACLPGTTSRNWCGDGQAATAAKLAGPQDVDVAADGTIVIADTGNNVIRRIGPDGVIGTLAGDGTTLRPRTAPPRAVEPAAHPRFRSPGGVAIAPDGSVLVADTGNHAIRRITADGLVTIVLGGPSRVGTRLSSPRDVVALPDGTVLVAETGNGRVLGLTPGGQLFTVVPERRFFSPVQLAVLPDGTMLIADEEGEQILRVGSDGGVGRVVEAPAPVSGVALGTQGTAVMALSKRARAEIMGLDPATGRLQRIAGTGRAGFSGDAGAATSVALRGPRQLALAPDGSLLIAEAGNDRIRRLTADGRLTTVAGTDRPREVAFVGPRGDGGNGTPTPGVAGGGGCFAQAAQFQVFNFVPGSRGTLRAGRKRLDVRIQTSVAARVRVEITHGGDVVRRRELDRVSNAVAFTKVTLAGRLERGNKYFVRMRGRPLSGAEVVRCDRRRVKVR
jgi:sugar lactone lactonase YvrE